MPLTPERLRAIAARYASLRIAVIGDFCLDRYLEIDPAREETSIETGLPVHNVVQTRAQPGAAGTILNNLVALGIGCILPVGFCGDDGEGYELVRALRSLPGVDLEHFIQTTARRTFTYCKPLVMHPGRAPVEMSRLDSKNWSATPSEVSTVLIRSMESVFESVDAMILMDQVDVPGTGAISPALLERLSEIDGAARSIPILADSRRGLRAYPRCIFKMNAAEFASLTGLSLAAHVAQIEKAAVDLARENQRPVFVTLAERGLVGAMPNGSWEHAPALPLRGPIDIVGAGDSVTANLAAALAIGASLGEAVQLAAIASSIVIHKLGTSGTASFKEIAEMADHSQLPPA